MSKHDRQYDAQCAECGRTQPKRSRWRRLCASCIKRAQGRIVTPPQRVGPGRRKAAR